MTTLDTVKRIKEKLYIKFKIYVDQHQPILLQGEQLQDDHFISDYDISKESLLKINLGT